MASETNANLYWMSSKTTLMRNLQKKNKNAASIFVQVLRDYLLFVFFWRQADKFCLKWNLTSWTPCSSVLNASHANAPTHQITLNAGTQLHGVIPIYNPPDRRLSLCRAYFFRPISISKLSVALHCRCSFKLISKAYLHPAFKPSDGSQIKVSQRVSAAHLLLYPHADRGCCPRHVLHIDDKISDGATTGGMSLRHCVHSGV